PASCRHPCSPSHGPLIQHFELEEIDEEGDEGESDDEPQEVFGIGIVEKEEEQGHIKQERGQLAQQIGGNRLFPPKVKKGRAENHSQVTGENGQGRLQADALGDQQREKNRQHHQFVRQRIQHDPQLGHLFVAPRQISVNHIGQTGQEQYPECPVNPSRDLRKIEKEIQRNEKKSEQSECVGQVHAGSLLTDSLCIIP